MNKMKNFNRYIKLLLVVASFIFLFVASNNKKIDIHADAEINEYDINILGVQLKYDQEYSLTDIGNNGIRFVAEYPECSGLGDVKYGILVCYGVPADIDDLTKENYTAKKLINEKTIGYYQTTTLNSENKAMLTLIGMPLDQKEQVISARAYVEYTSEDETYRAYSTTIKSINFVDTCRSVYNIQAVENEKLEGDVDNICQVVAEANSIKVTTSSTTKYYNDFNSVTSSAGSSIDLIRGEYNRTSGYYSVVSDVSISGPNSIDNITFNNDGSRKYPNSIQPIIGEAVLKFYLKINDGKNNININGITIDDENGVILKGSQGTGSTDCVSIKKTKFLYTNSSAITDESDSKSSNIHNIFVDRCYFENKNSATQASSDIKFSEYVNYAKISCCIFNSKATKLFERKVSSNYYYDEIVILLDKFVNGAEISINSNEFNHIGAIDQIKIGYGNTAKATAYIMIDSNDFSFTESMLHGNGIELFNLNGTDYEDGTTVTDENCSEVLISGNYNFNITPYFNSIVVTSESTITTSATAKIIIVICMENQFNNSGSFIDDSHLVSLRKAAYTGSEDVFAFFFTKCGMIGSKSRIVEGPSPSFLALKSIDFNNETYTEFSPYAYIDYESASKANHVVTLNYDIGSSLFGM